MIYLGLFATKCGMNLGWHSISFPNSELSSRDYICCTRLFKGRPPLRPRKREDHWYLTELGICALRATVSSFMRFSVWYRIAEDGNGKSSVVKSLTISISITC